MANRNEETENRKDVVNSEATPKNITHSHKSPSTSYSVLDKSYPKKNECERKEFLHNEATFINKVITGFKSFYLWNAKNIQPDNICFVNGLSFIVNNVKFEGKIVILACNCKLFDVIAITGLAAQGGHKYIAQNVSAEEMEQIITEFIGLPF